MNRRHLLSFAAAVAFTLPAAAQAPAQSAPQPHAPAALDSSLVWTPTTMQPGCPVDLRAQRGTGSGLVVTHGSLHHGPTGIAQQLHMTFTNRLPKNAVGVTLTVHGLTAAFRMMPATQSAAASSDGSITRTIHLDLSLDPNANASADLTLKSFTSVTRIDLDTIDYADGSNWKTSTAQTCRIAPDGLMLISTR
ncbi:MAG TPA: hypothetical protein VH250_11060 [Granulicella sp.]|nr:hypothetical protein [Granulicella sp.]